MGLASSSKAHVCPSSRRTEKEKEYIVLTQQGIVQNHIHSLGNKNHHSPFAVYMM